MVSITAPLTVLVLTALHLTAAQECTCTRFIIVTQITVQPVQTDNIINALVGTSVSVTCDAKLALLDSNVCEHRGCVKVKWTQNSTNQITGPRTVENFQNGLLSVSGELQLNPITWDNAGIYSCLIDYGQTDNSGSEIFRISLSELQFSGAFHQLTIGSPSSRLTCTVVPSITASTLRMLDGQGTTVTTSSGGSVSVVLPAVTQSLNGTVYTCMVTSQHLTQGEGNRTAVVTVRDTQLSTVMIENEEREVVEAVPSKQFNCTVTLSSPIGPDYSALSTIWRHNNQVVSGGSVQLVTAAAGPAVVDAFTSVLTLTSVAESDAGQYCCSAQLAGGTAPLSHCITITITKLTVTGQYQNLRVGSSAVINCTAPAVLTEQTLTWSDPNGVALVTSTAQTASLSLSPVDYTMRGSYTCTLTSPQLVNNRIETIAVTVDATHVTNLVATAPSVIAVQGTPSVVLSCVVSVSAEIGPDYSSLTVRWSLNGSPIVSVAPQPATSNQLQTSFMSSIEFTDIDTANAGQYCCVASMSGISGSRTACTSLTITEFMVSGSYQNLTVGSTTTLACSLGSLSDSTITWLSHDGTVVSSSGTLTLQSVDTTLNGRVFRCRVTSPSLYSSAERSTTVTVLDTTAVSAVFNSNQYYTLQGAATFDLQCTITLSNPIGPNHSALKVSWLHNTNNISSQASNPVASSTLSSSFTSTLRQTSIGSSHAGQYCCQANIHNTAVIRNVCTQVTVSDIVISNTYQNVPIGTTAVVTCSVPGVSTAAIQWLAANGSAVSNTNTLTLASVNSALNGQQFRCSVRLPGQASATTKAITVTIQSAFVTDVNFDDPPQYFVHGDQNVELQCTVTLSDNIGPGYSALSITWRDSNNAIHDCSDYGPQTGARSVFSCSLQLAVITQASAGVYVCSGQVAGSSVLLTDSASIGVQGSLQSANLLTPENAVIGQSSVLTCEVHTSLPVNINLLSVQWMHRGSPVTGSGGFALKQGSGAGASVYVTELTLTETTVERSGLYSCNVSLGSNKHISAEGNLTVALTSINVQARLSNGFPSQPLLGTSTRLNCSVTLHPQLSQLTILTIQYQWSSNGVTRGTGQELMLPNLRVQDAAEFTCSVTVSASHPNQLVPLAASSSFTLTIKITPPTVVLSPSASSYSVGQDLNATCISTIPGVTFSWRIVSAATDQTLLVPTNILSSGSQTSIAAFRPLTVFFSEAARIVCQLSSTNQNLLQADTKKDVTIAVPTVTVQVTSDRNTVTDISGYNSFSIQCSATVSPVYSTPKSALTFTLTRNNVAVTEGLTSTPAQQQNLELSQSSSVQQTAASGPATLVYRCTAALRIGVTTITMDTGSTQVSVKGPTLPRAAVLGHLEINSTTEVTVQWSVAVVTYSPEQYTVYYTTNSNGCPDSDDGFNKSVTVYGLNHTDYFTVTNQQYSVTLTNLQPIENYCYKVVSINTAGRTDSAVATFVTLIQSAPSGPPQGLTIVVTSRTLSLSWSPPPPLQQNGIITSYSVTCTSGAGTARDAMVTSTIHTFTGLQPFTNYTCAVLASTVVGDGPSAVKTVLTDEAVPETSPASFDGTSGSPSSITLLWNRPLKPNGVITKYQLQCSGGGQSFSPVVPGSQTTATLSGLLPYTSYSCSITAHTSVGGGPVATTSVTTQQDVPSGPPEEFSIFLPQGNPSMTLSWSPPLASQRNGVIISYLITCSSGGSIINSTRTSSTSLAITGLQPFTSYSCTVRAATIVGDGPAAVRNVVTRGERPESAVSNFTRLSVTSNSITLSWSPPAQSNGPVTGYNINCFVNDEPNTAELPGSVTSHTITGLRVFTLYTCVIIAQNVEGGGPPTSLSVLTDQDSPSGPPQEFVISVTTSSMTLSWSPPLASQRNGVIISYLVTCNSGGSIINRTRTSSTGLTITGLQPFTSYSCTVRAVTIVGDGPAAVKSTTTGEGKPSGGPVEFTADTVRSRSVDFSWIQPDRPNGVILEYRLYCSADNSVLTHSVPGSMTKATVEGLLPYTSYSCNITAHTSAGGGPAATISLTTAEDTPGKVSDLKTVTIPNSNSSLEVTWKPPASPNGIITGYELNISTPRFKVFDITGIPATATRHTVHDLFPFVPYYFTASARTRIGRGDPESVLNFVQEGVPEHGPPLINATRLSATQIEVHWRSLRLEDARGFITSYTATAEPVDSRRRQLAHSVTVGPNERRAVIENLDPSMMYHVAVSASTVAGESSENEMRVVPTFSSTTPTTPGTGGVVPTESLSGTIGAVAGGTVGLIVLAGLVIMACMVYHCYRHKERHETTDGAAAGVSVMELGNLKPAYLIKDEPEQQSTTTEGSSAAAGLLLGQQNWRSQPIILQAFPDHVTRMHQDGDNGFDTEFQALGHIRQRAYSVAKLPRNSLKNRVHNIFPFDHSRVELAVAEGAEDGSDYINASWINGFNKQRAYIATQGPLHHTVGDLWRMVWQQQLPTIVMLTKLTERGRPTCHAYWPTEEGQNISVGYGLSVYMSEEATFNGYKLRTLLLTNNNDPDSKPLPISHFQFTVWPNHGTPADKMTLIRFIQTVRKAHPAPECAPLLVHCSAGVGRTGTFIVLDTMLQRIRAEGDLNIYEFVTQLRTRRNLMMQSRSHYMYIHDALAEYITCDNTSFTPATVHDSISELRRVEREKTGFHRQFELLKKLTSNQIDFSCSDAETHTQLNRYSYNYPYNHNRVRLRSGASLVMGGYINASWIDTEWQEKAFIAAQAPMEETVDDFWTMLWEARSRVVVLLCTVVENNEDTCEKFWPSVVGESWVFGNLAVQLVSKQKELYYTASRMEVTYTGSLSRAPNSIVSLEVTLFHCKSWPENPVSITPPPLLSLVEAVLKTHSEANNSTITVACNDGLGRTGAFICIYYQLERLKLEETADVFQFVKACRLQRNGLVRYLDQYVFCYNVLETYVDQVERSSRHSSSDI